MFAQLGAITLGQVGKGLLSTFFGSKLRTGLTMFFAGQSMARNSMAGGITGLGI
ncbi:MAG: hypothetical protein KC933_41190 [Myxococcales bacterium]|nr:hypothetical protein [Myxococcales bacterium]MCB9652001.1 hypothetical protein [Deltaproteobacteria bacterium]